MESESFSGKVVSDDGHVIFNSVSGHFSFAVSDVIDMFVGVMRIHSGEMPSPFVGWLVLESGKKVRSSSLNDRNPMSIKCVGGLIDVADDAGL